MTEQNIIEEIRLKFSDNSVSPEETKAFLEGVIEECQSMLDTLP